MKISFLTSVLLLCVLYINYSSCQNELYQFNLNDRVNISGQPHFRINYYPNSSDTNYKGDFYPDLESNPNVRKYTFLNNITINSTNDLFTVGVVTPTYFVYSAVENSNKVLIIPKDITVIINSIDSISAVIVKGKLELNPLVNANYSASKTIIYPGGTFKSTPTATVNHTITLVSYYSTVGSVLWDPLITSTFISLGGIVRIKGSNTDSPWVGNNQGYGSTILRSFPMYDAKPVIKLDPTILSVAKWNSINYYYRKLSVPKSGNKWADDGYFSGIGLIYVHPWSKNVAINGLGDSSMVFTGNSSVDIQNSMFYDIGHTQNKKIIDNQLTVNLNVIQSGIPLNPPDRYPITLLHVSNFVNIENNAFLSTPPSTSRFSKIPKSFIGAKRSFGNIIGNAFVLKGGNQNSECTGISLLYGTEQFNISYNAFMSASTGDKLNSDYDDNCGISTASPYSIYENNAFEGTFRGGAIRVTPIQNRTSIVGLSQDQLLGKHAGLIQDNTMDFKVNNVWNSVIFKGNYFSGETELRYEYPSTCQPPIRVTVQGGWAIGQKVSLSLPPNNNTNIEFIYDSIYTANELRVDDRFYNNYQSSTHNGVYNAITLKNVRSTVFRLLEESFHCKYLSISDSIFTHYHKCKDLNVFLKKYADQFYFRNLNSTKCDTSSSIKYLWPFYQFSPYGSNQAITSNQINISFTPNFDFPFNNGQFISYIIDDVVQIVTPNLYKANFTQNSTLVSNMVQFSNITNYPNGPYNVMVSTMIYLAVNYTFSSGPFFANTYTVDIYAINFYLGINLSPDYNSSEPHQLSIFGNQWTTCGLINQHCKTTGVLSKVDSSLFPRLNISFIDTLKDEFKMLTSYLVNDNQLLIPTTLNITLAGPHQYKFYIYSFNPTWSDSNIIDSIPYFTIKINGKYQDPFTRKAAAYGRSEKYGPFYWNNDLSIDQVLHIEWASDNINYQIPLSGIEIYSSLNIPFSIPTTTTV